MEGLSGRLLSLFATYKQGTAKAKKNPWKYNRSIVSATAVFTWIFKCCVIVIYYVNITQECNITILLSYNYGWKEFFERDLPICATFILPRPPSIPATFLIWQTHYYAQENSFKVLNCLQTKENRRHFMKMGQKVIMRMAFWFSDLEKIVPRVFPVCFGKISLMR